ncbi:hypothetical protein ACFVIM_19760 [Streptomyces sp. NPDC057638]|uniref:hypothetical protein n=1 Tax=Streptomyces sp. NPDC057638 TaxID=3346190 RepID=UPI00369F6A8F
MTRFPVARASCTRTKGTLLASLLFLTACAESEEAKPPLRGTALGGDTEAATFTGLEDVEIGEEYRFALPLPYNRSATDLTVTGAKVINVPEGLSVTGMSAYARSDTDNSVVGAARPGDELEATLNRARDVIDEPIRVTAGALADRYYVVKIKVTGQVRGDIKSCRFTYKQESREYHQVIGCHYILNLKKR